MDVMQQAQPAKRRGPLSRLFGAIWGTISWLRTALLNLIFIIFLIIIVAAISSDESVQLPEKAALRIAPSGFLVDQRSYVDPMSQLLQDSSQDELETVVRDLINSIDAAAADPRITGLVLDLGNLVGGGLSKLDEIGQALERFKQTDKTIIATGDNFTQDQYYLASFADEIHLHPHGSVMLSGYSSYRNYYQSALEKLDINFHVFKVGTYKDYVETYTRNDMSEASREHNGQWLNQLWSMYSAQVEQRRELPQGTINNYINQSGDLLQQVGGDAAQLALNIGLIDKLSSRQSSLARLQKAFGKDEEETGYSRIELADYKDHVDSLKIPSGDKIGLIVASGNILNGQQPAGSIGGDSLSQLFRDARQNDDIKALVLRIDSGGGSAFASEIIREEMQATRDAGIPIVISMGSVAASGGYWVSTASDSVLATPATITGSIGIFAAFPTLDKTLANLGIYTDGVGTTDLAGSIRLDRPLSPLASSLLQQSIENGYQNFIELVAEARESSPEAIDKIAQGRVWSGIKAKELNLVDELGYLQDAIDKAAKLAKLEDYNVEEVVKPLTPTEEFMQQFAAASIAQALQPQTLLDTIAPASLRHALAPLAAPFTQLDNMNDPRGVYLQCMGCAAP